MQKIKFFIWCISISLICTTCTKDNVKPEPEKPTENNKPKVIVMDTAMVSKKLVEITTKDELVFSGLKTNETPPIGSIICSAPSDAAPQGYLYKVKQVTNSDGTTTITTEPATLEDAIEKIEISDRIDITNNIKEVLDKNGNPVSFTQSETIARSVSAYQSLKLSVNEKLQLANGVFAEIKGSLDIRNTLVADLVMDFWKINYFKIAIEPECKLKVDVKLKGELKGEKEVPLYTIKMVPITLNAGVIPIVLTPDVKVSLKISVSGSVEVSTTLINTDLKATFGVQYKDGQISFINEDNSKHEGLNDALNLKGEIELQPAFSYDVGIYNSSSYVGVFAAAFGKAKTDDIKIDPQISYGLKQFNPKIKVTAGLKLGPEAVLKIFKWDLGSFKPEITLISIPLWERTLFPEFSKIEISGTDNLKRKVSCTVTAYPFFTATNYGFCWGTKAFPQLGVDESKNLGKLESFATGDRPISINIDKLDPNRTYTVRPYFTNWLGTFYGASETFSTEQEKNLELSKTSVSVLSGKSESITITSGSGKYGVKSSNTNVAIASLSGNSITITGKNEGSATISVHDSLLVQTKTIAVTVMPFTIVPLSVSKDAVGINVGQSETISITSGGGFYTVTRGDVNIADISLTGSNGIKITGVSAGNTSFIIKDDKSGQQVTVSVTVAAMAEMVITPGDITLNVGESRQATVINGVGPYAFIIANTAIASVTQVGNILTIKGLAAGQTTISVRDFGTGQSKVINVMVSGGSSGIGWKMVACGHHFTAAIKTDGSLWAWGDNNMGQLGDGTTLSKAVPQKIGSDKNWSYVACVGQRTFAIKNDGSLWACGMAIDLITPVTTIMRIGNDNNWAKFSGGLAIKTNGELWEWRTTGLTRIGTDNNWQDADAGGCYMAIKTNGELWGWGDNKEGQLGDGTTISKSFPVRIGVSLWKQIACRDAHVTNSNSADGAGVTVGVKTDGTLWAWGSTGNLDGTQTYKILPYQIGASNDWKAISVGGGYYYTNSVLAIKNNGTLWGWGSNEYGRLGIGVSGTKISFPMQIGNDNKWVQIAAGPRHSFAIKSDGSLWGWGINATGALGDGTTTDRLVPTKISD